LGAYINKVRRDKKKSAGQVAKAVSQKVSCTAEMVEQIEKDHGNYDFMLVSEICKYLEFEIPEKIESALAGDKTALNVLLQPGKQGIKICTCPVKSEAIFWCNRKMKCPGPPGHANDGYYCAGCMDHHDHKSIIVHQECSKLF